LFSKEKIMKYWVRTVLKWRREIKNEGWLVEHMQVKSTPYLEGAWNHHPIIKSFILILTFFFPKVNHFYKYTNIIGYI